MVKMGRYNVGFNRSANVGSVMMNIFMLILWLGVGDILITAVGNFVDFDDGDNTFYETYRVLGLNTADSGTGLVSIIGILLAIGIVIQVFKVTRV